LPEHFFPGAPIQKLHHADSRLRCPRSDIAEIVLDHLRMKFTYMAENLKSIS